MGHLTGILAKVTDSFGPAGNRDCLGDSEDLEGKKAKSGSIQLAVGGAQGEPLINGELN